jgi:serine/threonine-protein kinase
MSPGLSVAHYRITVKLGQGGMGEVWRATDTKLGREVAVKILPEVFAQDADRMARFQREAHVLASLNHPNIAHIYGVQDRALVIELVEGETLPAPLPIETGMAYARQIAEALEYAHEKGVIHRDLKPANIKVTAEGTVKLLDFGLAKAVEDRLRPGEDLSDSPTLTLGATRVGVVLGTAAYMSPEQASGKPADRRADIWSFGAVLYEMLAGKKAFEGESVSDTLASVLKLDPDWTALPDATPPNIRNLIRRCLTKDRRQRLQAIGEARITLESPAEELAPATPPSRSWVGIAGWLVAAAATLVAANLALVHFRQPPLHPLMQFEAELGRDLALPQRQWGSSIVLSPDGSLTAVVVRRADGQVQLGTRRLDQSQITLLPGTEGAFAPFSLRMGGGSLLIRQASSRRLHPKGVRLLLSAMLALEGVGATMALS